MIKKKKSSVSRVKKAPRTLAYPVEFRLRVVRLYLEGGYSRILLREQFGVSAHSIQRWVRAYRLVGASYLKALGVTPEIFTTP
jgi:transposase-like protein